MRPVFWTKLLRFFFGLNAFSITYDPPRTIPCIFVLFTFCQDIVASARIMEFSMIIFEITQVLPIDENVFIRSGGSLRRYPAIKINPSTAIARRLYLFPIVGPFSPYVQSFFSSSRIYTCRENWTGLSPIFFLIFQIFFFFAMYLLASLVWDQHPVLRLILN